MKTTNKFTAAAIVAVGLFAGSVAANAQKAKSLDLVFAMDTVDQNSAATGGQLNYELDLGNIYQLDALAPTAGSTTTFNLSSDLSTVFGTYNRATDPTGWSVFGTNTNTSEVYSVNSKSPTDDANGTLLPSLSNEMSAIYSDLNSNTNPSGPPPVVLASGALETPSSDPNSYWSDITNGGNGSSWNNGLFNGGNAYKLSTSTTAIGLYDINDTDGNPSSKLGTFSLANGVLTYTDLIPQTIPEPSVWASIVIGAASLLAVRRRRRVA